MDLGDESGEILLDQDDDDGEGSDMDSGREEDSGGGDFQFEDGNSNDHSSIDTPQNSAHGSLAEPGPSGILTQPSEPVSEPSVQETAEPPAPEPDLTTPAPIPLTAANINAAGYVSTFYILYNP